MPRGEEWHLHPPWEAQMGGMPAPLTRFLHLTGTWLPEDCLDFSLGICLISQCPINDCFNLISAFLECDSLIPLVGGTEDHKVAKKQELTFV